MNQPKMGPWENFWYYVSVIFSFGAVFTLKVIVKKAVIEANGHSSATMIGGDNA